MSRNSSKSIAVLALLTALSASGAAVAKSGAILLKDDFNGPTVDTGLWHMPTWQSPSDGTFIGRTQLAVTQNSGLPAIVGSSVLIPIQTHSPRGGNSFYGTELISNREFPLGQGLDIKVRAKISTTDHPGLVGGIFLYTLKAGSNTLHDEIDFEFLTNRPDQVQTNIYGNEELGIGHAEFRPFATGLMSDYHTYEIQWRKGKVSWLIDGKVVRTTTEHVPAGPMQFYLNNWAPDRYWPQAFNPEIQPVKEAASNAVLDALTVDSVTIRSLGP
jgi:beta-glucanase (GH16 family)